MALRFISHKEIAFRQLLGMLRTPPVAVMNYYTNLFLSARFVFGDQPEKIRRLDKEIRRVECMVGTHISANTHQIEQKLKELANLRKEYENDINRLESLYENADEDAQKEIQQAYEEVQKALDNIDKHEYFLLYKLEPLYNLKMIETYMDNNMDLKSFFKEHGKVVMQMEVNSELEKIKIWVYQEAVEMMPYIRFTKLE